jgi:hypothetical protein
MASQAILIGSQLAQGTLRRISESPSCHHRVGRPIATTCASSQVRHLLQARVPSGRVLSAQLSPQCCGGLETEVAGDLLRQPSTDCFPAAGQSDLRQAVGLQHDVAALAPAG